MSQRRQIGPDFVITIRNMNLKFTERPLKSFKEGNDMIRLILWCSPKDFLEVQGLELSVSGARGKIFNSLDQATKIQQDMLQQK